MSDSSHRKGPSSKDNPNYDLCEFLMELSAYERNVSRNVFKSNAYRSAASALAAYPTRVTGAKEASKISGIGKKISEKIEEFLTTGKLKKLEKIRADDTSTALTELTRVSGVGPAKARQLYDAGITDIPQLKKHTDLLTHHQIIGLKYVEDFEKKIPRAEVKTIEEAIKDSLSAMQQQYFITVCGSYRRGSERSGDIDVLLTYKDKQSKEEITNKNECKKRPAISDDSSDEDTDTKSKTRKKIKKESVVPSDKSEINTNRKEKKAKATKNPVIKATAGGSRDGSSSSVSPDSKEILACKANHRAMLQSVVQQLQQDDIVTDTLSLGDTKFMGVCRVATSECHRRLDIRLLAPDHYSCGVLYFTGSDLFNKDMRTQALAAGFTVNEYSIRPMDSTGVPGEPLPVTSEQDIFDYIGMKYKTPDQRNM